MNNKVLFIISFITFIIHQVKSKPAFTDPCEPQQIHLALSDAYTYNPTTNNYAKVLFHTQEECKSAYISLKTPQGETKKIAATAVNFFTTRYQDNVYNAWLAVLSKNPKKGLYATYVHIFDFANLDFSKTYEYTCYGKDEGTSQTPQGPFQFYVPSPTYNSKEETRVVMFGDMDSTAKGQATINQLKNIAKKNFTKIHAFIHHGDMSYELEGKAGTVGDNFMKAIQDFTATMPYMVTAGNHEAHANFTNFNMRYHMPNHDKYQNHYYSFNLGNIHFTTFNIDLLIEEPHLKQYMLDWLEKDLQKATQDKDNHPWIVAVTHRPHYCSSPSCGQLYKQFPEFDGLLAKYNVDLVVSGHVHNYERSIPMKKGQMGSFRHLPKDENYNYIVNPEAPVHVVQGRAGYKGCTDHDGNTPKAFSARMDNLTFSFLSINSKNSTHLLVENFQSSDGTPNDHFYIIKSKNQDLKVDDVNLIQIPEAPLKVIKHGEDSSLSAIKIENSFFLFIIMIFLSLLI